MNRLTSRFFIYAFSLTALLLVFSVSWFVALGVLVAFIFFVVIVYYDSFKSDWAIEAEASFDKNKLYLGETSQFEVKLNLNENQFYETSFFEFNIKKGNIYSTDLKKGIVNRQKFKQDMKQILKGKVIPNKVGVEKFCDLFVVVHSRLGFWQKKIKVKVDKKTLLVWPEFSKIPSKLIKEKVHGLKYFGGGPARKGLVRDEFHSLRPFIFSDPLARIDAKKSAKMGSLMTRTYESKKKNHFVIVLDKGRSMLGKVGDSRKVDYYFSSALHLIEIAQKNGDEVSLILLGKTPEVVIKKSSNNFNVTDWFKKSNKIDADNCEPSFWLLPKVLNRISPQRSLLFVLTDLSRPSVQEAVLKNLRKVFLKHRTFVSGFYESEYDFDSVVNKFSPSKIDKTENWNKLMYSLWMNDETEKFGFKIGKMGASAACVSHDKWLSLADQCYKLMRTHV